MEFLLSVWCCSPYYALVPSRDGEIRSLSRLLSIFFSLVLRRLVLLFSWLRTWKEAKKAAVHCRRSCCHCDEKFTSDFLWIFYQVQLFSVLYYTKGWACPPAEVHHHSYIRRQEGAEKIQLTEIRRPTCLDWEIDCSTALFLFLWVQIEQVECPIFISSIQPIGCKLFIRLHQ